jgi:hypothetical protein
MNRRPASPVVHPGPAGGVALAGVRPDEGAAAPFVPHSLSTKARSWLSSCPRGWSRRMRQNERGGVRGSDQLFSRPAAAGPMGAPGGVRSGSCRAATQGPGGRAGVWAAPLRASRRRFSARNCGAARVPIDRLARTSRKVTSQPIGATMVRGCGPADVLCPRPSPHRIRRSQAGPSAVRAPASGETATPA